MHRSTPGRSFREKFSRIVSAIGSFLAARLAGRAQAGAESALHIEEKLSLGPKKKLYLVSCREREFLIAAGAETIVSMIEVASPGPVRIVSRKKASVTRIERREPLA